MRVATKKSPPTRSGTGLYQHILVPLDGSKLSFKALDAATELATAMKSRLTLYRAMGDDPAAYADECYSIPKALRLRAALDARFAAEGELTQLCRQGGAAGLNCTWLITKTAQPWKGIIDTAARKNCDLIVMASHGRGGLGSLILGSVTQKVLALSKIPVIVCR